MIQATIHILLTLFQKKSREYELLFNKSNFNAGVQSSGIQFGGGSKATGPDGIPGSFNQKSWDTIKVDLLKVVQSFFNSSHMPKKWNETSIVLIPKVKVPETIPHFRPISLINFSYKVISKIMVNRLKPIVNDIISLAQSAFVTG